MTANEERPEMRGGTVELDWSGCLLTDRGSVEEMPALPGDRAHYRGRWGVIEAIRLAEGTAPWPGSPWPRPVYRVRWRPDA